MITLVEYKGRPKMFIILLVMCVLVDWQSHHL